jgi:hypothetical protein
MSQTIAQPIGNNVVPFPPQPGGGPPPGMMPNPAFAQWQQQAQQVRAVQMHNQQLQQQFDAAVALIKRDGIHGFRLDIEADSTIAPDEEAEKQARVEFLQQMVPLLQQVVPVAQGNPPLSSLVREIVLFAARGFRVARPLEETIENAFDAIGNMPPAPPPGGKGTHVDPAIEQAKVAADVHDTQMRAQTEAGMAQMKAQTEQAAIAQKAQAAVLQAQTAQQRMAAEERRAQADAMMQAAEMAQRERLANVRVERQESAAARGLV